MKNDVKATGTGSTTHPNSENTFSPFFSLDSYAVKEISMARAAKLLRRSRSCRSEVSTESDMDRKELEAEKKSSN